MSHTLRVYPKDELVIVRFTGDVFLSDLRTLENMILQHTDYQLHYVGLYDFRESTKRYTHKDLLELIKLQPIHPDKGRWCSLNSTPVDTALAMLYAVQRKGENPFNVFSTIPAASDFLNRDLASRLKEFE
jgi:hypothetical protein